MNEDIKKTINIIASYLKNLGFKKKSLTWYKEKKDFILLIDLQKSSWSPEYYINVGIIFDKVDEKLLKTYKSDVQYRVSDIDKQNKYKDIFKIEHEADNLVKLIQKQVIEKFDNLETFEELKTKILTDKDKNYNLNIKAKEKFNVKE